MLAATLAFIVLSLAWTGTANAQPAICDEYPDLPACDDNPGGGPPDNPGGGPPDNPGGGPPDNPGGGPPDNPGGSPGGGGPGGPPGSPGNSRGEDVDFVTLASDGNGPGSAGGTGAGTELPFIDYPTTPLLMFLLVLVSAGIAIRAGIAIHNHLRQRGAAAAVPPPA